jgi:cytochrome c-type biogenesis protein CcsB
MKIKYFFIFIVCLIGSHLFSAEPSIFDPMKQVPVLYKGRYRPLDVYSRLWLYELFHKEQFSSSDAKKIGAVSALDLLWKLNFLGHEPWKDAPLFWLESDDLKKILNLDIQASRFSYKELQEGIYQKKETNLALVNTLVRSSFLEAYHKSNVKKKELSDLAPGLWTLLDKGEIIVTAVPAGALWKFLKPGDRIGSQGEVNEAKKLKSLSQDAFRIIGNLQHFSSFDRNEEKIFEHTYQSLLSSGLTKEDAYHKMEGQFPLSQRLQSLGDWLRIIPLKKPEGVWVSPRSLEMQTLSKKEIPNITPYPPEDFNHIRTSYLGLKNAIHEAPTDDFSKGEVSQYISQFSHQLLLSYSQIAGKEYLKASGKALTFPTLAQLKMESLSYRLPLIEIVITLYILAVLLSRAKKLGLILLLTGFLIHTMVIALRCFVLQRPPVTNMFESVIYVPWITVLAALILRFFMKNDFLLFAASLAASLLLILLHFTGLNRSMDNVQAVLDSQYWLIVHVLMVVGSYGLYLLAGILGHLYLAIRMVRRQKRKILPEERPPLESLAKLILQSMYLGTAFLIPGTILGGIWAAESWGRFWDWDPKEAWAFISSCVYLIWIHAYRFGLIRNFGLAFGAVTGLLAISFTWYGVNYILGTGLHSYGFGDGGELYYYLFLSLEVLFLFCCVLQRLKERGIKETLQKSKHLGK